MIFLVIILALLAIALFIIIGFWARFKIDERARDNCEELVNCTIDFAKENLGFIRVISGPIRSGKSTMTAGLTHSDQIIIRDTAREKIDYARTIMHDVDWVSIDKDIEEQHELTHDRFQSFRFIKKKYSEQFEDKEYDNHLKIMPYLQLLNDYIYAYFRLLDNNFVLSNIDCYSHITGNYNFRFDPKFMKIKELVISNDNKVTKTNYPIMRYTTIFEDEKLLGDKTNIKFTTDNSDDGSPVFLRLLGQLGKETIYYNTTAQNALRILKTERELATSIIYINGHDVIGNLPFKSWLLKKRIARNNKKMMKYARKHYKHDEEGYENFLKSDSKFKQKHMKYKDELNAIFAEAYLSYHCVIYRRVDDIGKTLNESHGAMKYDMVFPVAWCFGSIDSHYYSFIQDYLEGYGRSPYYELEKETNSSISEFAKAKEFLKQKKKEEKPKVTDKEDKKTEGKKKEEKKNDDKKKESGATDSSTK